MPRWHRPSKNWGGQRLGAGRPVQTIPTRRLSITLPETLVQALDRQADRHHMTRSAVIAQYLARALEP